MSTSAELLLERVRSATEDEYTLERELGRGGMAAVFLARDKALDRRVAIKVMLPDLINVEGIEDRFVIEAKTAAHLDHAGIVTVYSVKQRAGLLFIVMKFIEGKTLDQILKEQRRLEPSVVMAIVSKVAEALHFAHGEGVIHRDVKPSNIIIDTRGRPVVTDFGIAKVTSARSITVTGSMLGTPTYMSPEQCRGLPATAASDQYSLGVMTYEMLTGRVPFTGTIFELINAHCHDAPPPITEPGMDAALQETVLRMLAKGPQERWESLTEVVRRLAPAAQHRPTAQVNAMIADYVKGEDALRTVVSRRSDTLNLGSLATEIAATSPTTPSPALVITPDQPTIEMGETLQMRVSEQSGASLAGVRITWRSEDPTIATVDANGVVTGTSVGLAKITATGGAAIGRVAVSIVAPAVDTLVVTPQSPEIVVDAEVQLRATVLDSRGGTLGGQEIKWESSDVRVCVVSRQGLAIGAGPGTATITASSGAVRGTAQARVRLPAVTRVVIDPGEVSIETEETRKLTVTALAANDREVPGRTFAWRSTVPAVATVDAQGTLKGISDGTAAIIATCDGKEGQTSVTVRAQPVVAVRIQPEHLQLEVGRSLQLKGIGQDRLGRTVSEKRALWHSDDEQVVRVDDSGKVHAQREGKTVVRAVVGDATNTIQVTVIPRAAKQIRIEPHAPSLDAGEFLSLDATVMDDVGGELARAVTWASSNTAIVDINTSTGACEAKKPGNVMITASCEGVRTTTKLAVAAAAAAAATVVAEAATTVIPRLEVPRDAGRSAPPPPRESAPATTPAPAVPAASAKRSLALPIGGAVLVVVAVLGYVFTRGSGSATPGPQVAQVQTPPPATPTASAPARSDTAAAPAPQTKAPATPPGGTPAPPQKSVTTANPPGGTKAAPPQTKQSEPVRGATPPQTQTAPPPVTNPPASSGGSISGGAGSSSTARADSIAKAAVTNPPPVTTPPPATNNPPSGSAAPNADHAAVCGIPAAPVNALNEAFGADPRARLTSLYVPRDAADGKAKDGLLNTLKDAQRLKAGVRAVKPQGDPCTWTVMIDFSWASAFGANKAKSYEVTLLLDPSSGSAKAKQISNAIGR